MIFDFARPWLLLLLLAVPLWYVWQRRAGAGAIVFSRASVLGDLASRRMHILALLPERLRGLALTLLIIALAGPRTGSSVVDIDAEGIAIVLTLDISSSMLAEDLSPTNRMEVARATARDFVQHREYDRIGMVAFAGEALTQVPITIDYDVLLESLHQLQAGSGMLEDGTAIGTAIATAANRLRRVDGKSRVIVLVTDGENNRGEIDPLTAARAAAAYGIKIYTIGIGTEGVARVPVARGPFGVQYATLPVHIDETLLTQIAQLSGGRYFRAQTSQALQRIFTEIDRLEKTTVQIRRYVDYTPRHLPLILAAIALLVVEWYLRQSKWGKVP
ncbi:MAG TPA: VWA domain-containing protein [Longimicrobiales bacterium]